MDESVQALQRSWAKKKSSTERAIDYGALWGLFCYRNETITCPTFTSHRARAYPGMHWSGWQSITRLTQINTIGSHILTSAEITPSHCGATEQNTDPPTRSKLFKMLLISTCVVEISDGKHWGGLGCFNHPEWNTRCLCMSVFYTVTLDIWAHAVNWCVVSNTLTLAISLLDLHPCPHRLGAFWPKLPFNPPTLSSQCPWRTAKSLFTPNPHLSPH